MVWSESSPCSQGSCEQEPVTLRPSPSAPLLPLPCVISQSHMLHALQPGEFPRGGGGDTHRVATHSAIRRTQLPGAGGIASPARYTHPRGCPVPRPKIAWELNPHTSLVCYSDP
jgi:hypothetical protein